MPSPSLFALMEVPTLPLQDPVLIVAVVLAIVLILPLLARLLHIPDIVLLIVAGMVFGGNGLGLLERGQAMEVWGTIGLLYIMFLAGLELNVGDFVRNRNRCLLLGLFSFALPQGVGALLGVWILGFSWTKAILMGSMLASFTLLTYPMVSRLGLARRESVMVAVGATLITDTLALLVLAVVVEAHGQSLTAAFALRLALAFGIFLAIVLLGIPLLGRWFFRKVGRDGGAQFLFVLMVAFLCGSLSRLAGVEPIIGAFLAGVTMNRLVPPQGALMNRIEFVGRNLFIPFFLLAVGMVVDPRVFLAERATWAVGGVMVGGVLATKYLAAYLTQRLLGYSRDERWVIFGLTVTQAAATLAAVMVGFQLGLFDEAVLNGAIMMILATCVASPLITQHYARRVALSSKEPESAPSAESGRILIPVDNPLTSDSLVELAMLLRSRDSAEPIIPLRVVTTEQESASDIARGERLLLNSISQAAAAEVPATPAIRVAAGVAEGVRRAAVELRASTILMGWTRQSAMGAAVFGGILDDVLATCQTRVLACHLRVPLNTVNRVFLEIPPNAEHESGFRETLDMVWQLAQQIGAGLTVACPRAARPVVRDHARKFRDRKEVQWPDYGSWSEVRSALLGVVGSDVMRVCLMAREGGVSWRPGLDRLPRALLAPNNLCNLVLVYPGLPGDMPATSYPPQLDALRGLVGAGGAHLAEAGEPLGQALGKALRPLLGAESRAGNEVVHAVQRVAADFPIELTPDIALLHTSTPHLAVPRLFVLCRPERWDLADTEPAILLVLLEPLGIPPDRHLKLLSALAQLVRNSEWVDALRGAENDEALLALLRAELEGA